MIILLDNDDAVTKFSDMLSKVFHLTVSLTTSQPFYHLTDNLYLVKTPEAGPAGKSCIEDLFDASTHKIAHEAKIFNPNEKTFDPTKHLGKVDFAKKVVAIHAGTIPWSGFDPLLARVTAVLDHYSIARKPALPAAAKPTP